MKQGLTEEKTKYCPSCGAMIEYKYAVCPACGKPQPPLPGVEAAPRAAPAKNTALAVILSLLVTGLGQVYLGRWRRGLLIMGATLVIGFLIEPYVTWEQSIAVGVVLGVAAAVDAYRIAKGQA